MCQDKISELQLPVRNVIQQPQLLLCTCPLVSGDTLFIRKYKFPMKQNATTVQELENVHYCYVIAM